MKNLRIFVAISLLLAAGCNRPEAEDPVTPEKPKGKYELKELTATLPEADTKTELDNQTKVVRWKAGDRIMVIASDGTQKQYLLDAGEGTSVGKFVPLNTPVTFDEASELRAVSPACAVAGDVSGSDIPLRINSDLSENYTSYGLTSWNSDTQSSFSVNDIKVATGTGTCNSNSDINFKFTQLVTICDITLDFTSADKYDLDYGVSDYIKKILISGVDGISGTAIWNSSTGTLTSGNKNTIEWSLSSPKDMRYPQTFRLLMYPQVTTSSTLSIQVTTNRHFFNFTGRPDQNFAGGTYYKLPISVDKNFSIGGSQLAYTVVDITQIPLYYYGNTNCYLMPSSTGDPQVFNIDVTPHATDAVYHNYDLYKTGDVSGAPAVSGSELVWKEGTITSLTLGTITNNSLPVTVVGNGNAVVAIKDASDHILWSYHIWCPTETPGTIDYPVTNSFETYKIMNMPLGATKSVTAASSDADKLLGAGLYYQWGRKDPMGRNGAAASNSILVVKDGSNNDLTLTSSANIWFDSGKTNSLEDAYNTYASSASDPVKTVTRYMIDYTIANPSMFIMTDKTPNDWAGTNDNNLWGNFHSDDYPKQSKVYKSIFDPCPQGYRVAPKDTWVNFTSIHANVSNDESKYNVSGSFSRGFTFYLDGWKTGSNTDFYLASGIRYRSSGALSGVGGGCCYWSSAPDSYNAIRLDVSASYVSPLSSMSRAYAFPVRCVKEPTQ